MKKRLWLLPLTAIAAGALACLLTGRTAAHAATIALAMSYLAGTAYLTDRCLPNAQSRRVRQASGAIFAIAALVLLGFYTWHFRAESTIFINDDSLYYYMQLSLSEPLNTGLSATWAHFRESLGTDYTCLPNLLLAPVFSLTGKTADGFGLAAALMSWPLLMYQLRRITLRLADRLGFSGWRTLLLCTGSCIIVLTLPILHRAALWRQVNLLGLPLLLQVIFLSRGMDFRRWQPGRAAALFASCVLLALTRRWFLFFLAGWLPLWGLCTLWKHLRRKEWRAILRMAGYAALCAVLGVLLLWPMLSRALAGNYTESYAYWRKDSGGLAYEMKNQLWMLGSGAWVLIVSGCLWGLLQRRSRPLRGLSEAPALLAMTPAQVVASLETEEEASLLRGTKHIIIGGAAVDAQLGDILRGFPNGVWSTYGMTETLSHIALRRLNGPDASDWYTPFNRVSLRLAEGGTLAIHAPAVCAEELITNDIAELREDGCFRILGRRDNVIVSGGIKIQIEDVEAQLLPVVSCAFQITAAPDEHYGEVVVMLVEKQAGDEPTAEAVRSACQVLHSYSRPKHIFFVEKLPLTGSGKPDRAGARELARKLMEECHG